jgi:hypothetical protein
MKDALIPVLKCLPCENPESESSFAKSVTQFEKTVLKLNDEISDDGDFKHDTNSSIEEEDSCYYGSDENERPNKETLKKKSSSMSKKKTSHFKYEFTVLAKALDYNPLKFCRSCWGVLYGFTKYRMDETSKNLKNHNTIYLNPQHVVDYNDKSYHDLSYNKTFELFVGTNGVGVKQGIKLSFFCELSLIESNIFYHDSNGNDSVCFNAEKFCSSNIG